MVVTRRFLITRYVTIPQLCTGGDAIVAWTIADLCDTIEVQATFTVTPALQTDFTQPANSTVNACDLADQTALQAAFQAWVTEQTTAIDDSFAGGCDPQVSDNSATVTIPAALHRR